MTDCFYTPNPELCKNSIDYDWLFCWTNGGLLNQQNNATIMEMTGHNHTHTDTCFDCAEACERCATACLEMHDSDSQGHDMTACIKLCRDCADICTLCGRLAARGSQFMQSYMKVCAEACDACADECEKHASHHAHCKACAEACRKCAEECRAMAA